MRKTRALLVPALIGAQVLLSSGAAHAATGVTKVGSTVSVTASPGKANAIRVWVEGSSYVIHDTGDTVTAGAGCVAVPNNPNRVTCPVAGVTVVDVRVGDGNDLVSVGSNVTVIAVVYGGTGNDQLYGGGGDDRLFGEDGDDRLSGNGGFDRGVGGLGVDACSLEVAYEC